MKYLVYLFVRVVNVLGGVVLLFRFCQKGFYESVNFILSVFAPLPSFFRSFFRGFGLFLDSLSEVGIAPEVIVGGFLLSWELYWSQAL